MNKRVGVQEEATACSRRKLDAARSMRRSERDVKEEARTRERERERERERAREREHAS